MADRERPSIDPSRIASREFSSSFRGFDPTEVRNYLREVADSVRRLESDLAEVSKARPVSLSPADDSEKDRRIAELEAELNQSQAKVAAAEGEQQALRADIEALKSAPIAPAELDESALTKLLGEETTRVLDSARSAAADISARAQAEADRRTAEIDAFQSKTNEDLTRQRIEADEYAAKVRADADAETAELVSTVTAEANKTRSDALAAAEEARAAAEAEAVELQSRTESETAALRAEAEEAAEALRIESEANAEAAKVAANEVATAVKARAEEVARDTRLAAEADAEQIKGDAVSIRSDAQADAARMRAEAEADAQTSADAAREEARLMVTEAQSVREKVLSDLVKRRRVGRAQLDQVKAARDRMARSLAAVKLQVDESIHELDISIPEAKRAMEEAARPAPANEDDESSDARLDAVALAIQLDSARKAGNPIVKTDTPTEEVEPKALDIVVEEDDDDAVSDELDGLFARIREQRGEPAETTGSVEKDESAKAADAEAAPYDDDDDPEEDDPNDLSPSDVARVEGEVPLNFDALAIDALAAVNASDEQPVEQDAVDQDEADDDEPEEEEIDPGPHFTARDIAVTRHGADLRRKLKRALADDQSDVLDRLQQARRKMSLDDLSSREEQIERYRKAAAPALIAVAKAGASHGKGSVKESAVDVLLDRIDTVLVSPLRNKTERSISRADGEVDEALEAVRAHYRDGRASELPSLIDDVLAEAFAIGLYESIRNGAPVEWIIDPRVTASPDCFDNTFADDVSKPGEFPTGHKRPLGSPGCRCLVIARV